jgi:hypothetical protein
MAETFSSTSRSGAIMTLLFKCPKCGARRQREGFYVRTQHCICGWGVEKGEQRPVGGGNSPSTPPLTPPSPCDPADACATHGRCWVHSHWADDRRYLEPPFVTAPIPTVCEMCNGVGFYVSLPGDVISPCPYCAEKDSTRLTAEPVDSGSCNDGDLASKREQS